MCPLTAIASPIPCPLRALCCRLTRPLSQRRRRRRDAYRCEYGERRISAAAGRRTACGARLSEVRKAACQHPSVPLHATCRWRTCWCAVRLSVRASALGAHRPDAEEDTRTRLQIELSSIVELRCCARVCVCARARARRRVVGRACVRACVQVYARRCVGGSGREGSIPRFPHTHAHTHTHHSLSHTRSIPIVITSVLNFIMNVVDLAMVGHLGPSSSLLLPLSSFLSPPSSLLPSSLHLEVCVSFLCLFLFKPVFLLFVLTVHVPLLVDASASLLVYASVPLLVDVRPFSSRIYTHTNTYARTRTHTHTYSLSHTHTYRKSGAGSSVLGLGVLQYRLLPLERRCHGA